MNLEQQLVVARNEWHKTRTQEARDKVEAFEYAIRLIEQAQKR